jgi:hypothetical protein
MLWEPCLVHLLVPFASLVHDDINDLVLLADIFGRRGDFHNLVDDFAEQRHITTRVVADGTDEFAHILGILSCP